MSKVNKINQADALLLAGRLASALMPHCHRIQIVGSIRRGVQMVSDIEFLVVPYASLWSVLDGWDEKGYLRPRTNKNGANIAWNGTKQRCIEVYDRDLKRWVAVDLFFTDMARWACALFIRTGDKDFSRLLVTARNIGGMLPSNLIYKDWLIWNKHDHSLVPTKIELDIFRAVGLPYIPPYQRDKAVVKKWVEFKVYGCYYGELQHAITNRDNSYQLQVYRKEIVNVKRYNQYVTMPKGLVYIDDDWFHDGKRLKVPDVARTVLQAGMNAGMLGRPAWGYTGGYPHNDDSVYIESKTLTNDKRLTPCFINKSTNQIIEKATR